MENNIKDTLSIEERAIELLKTVFDPEIPVNVYDL
ncbi:MAG: FeS assembly SUF system protein, partial [Bacteroidaceae bacterium]|nr:FeS assembly SUF system protein [Bacteroidaceae bacterium]